MSTLGQIWHVVKNDVRRFRGLLALHGIVLGGAVLQAIGPRAHIGGTAGLRGVPEMWFMAVIFMSMLLTTLIVQADSPSRSDAFWATRPLRPLAVLAAKAATVGFFLLLLPAAAEFVVLMEHSVQGADAAIIMRDGVLVQFGVLMATALIAALTPDVATFFTATAAATAGTMALGAIVFRFVPNAFFYATWLQVTIPVILVGGGVLAYQYTTRNVRRSLAAAGVGTVLSVLLVGAIAAPDRIEYGTAATALAATDVEWGTFDVERVPESRTNELPRWTLRSSLQLGGGAPAHEYAIYSARTRLQLGDGTVVNGRIRTGPVATTRVDGSPSAENGAGSSNTRAADRAPERLTVAVLTQPELDALISTGGRLELVGARVDVLAPREMARVELDVGARLEAHSHKGRVTAVGSPGTSGPFIEMLIEEVRPFNDPLRRGYAGLKFAFVNPQTGETLIGPWSRSMASSHGMVLAAGGYPRAATVNVQAPATFADGELRPARDAAWFDRAELSILETVPVGSYPLESAVDVELTIDESESGSR